MKIAAIAALALAAGAALAGPVVTYSVSGSAGDWVLDFSVTNNLNPADMGIYFFGVDLDTGRNIAGSPTGYDPNVWFTWDNSGYGGSTEIYNNNWIEPSYSLLLPGQTLSGFQAVYTGALAPMEVDYFCYGASPYGSLYSGTDNFNNQWNPGFEGTAYIPTPASLGVIGLASVFVSLRRRR